jgi:hypothetical protein
MRKDIYEGQIIVNNSNTKNNDNINNFYCNLRKEREKIFRMKKIHICMCLLSVEAYMEFLYNMMNGVELNSESK